ncbi:MAG TPA: UDP-N-acetylmuramoyl-L-alanine--D-glutamate ligase, partial [Solirubrobacteraceae bacterium]|nr:UDP-N-acetylmuramoyl-L-alanine--D-glutamate ligase [Solirubrobacteraceae bacterium]
MTPGPRRPALPPGPWLVVGIARSGLAAARALRDRGEDVVAVDARPVAPAAAADELRALGVGVRAPSDGLAELDAARAVCKSPGVPRGAPVVAAALERGLPVLGELELGWRLLPNAVVAVTGTNGKTTTTELLGHVHRVAGLPVAVAGNVGTALSSLAGRIDAAATVVLEASSFQLEDADAFAPDCAVLLNVAPDHLDRHGTFEDYRAAKLRIFARQGAADVAVVPASLDPAAVGGRARRVPFGRGPRARLAERDGALWWDGAPLLDVAQLALRGAHNVQNAMAAAAAALARGVDPAAVGEGL